MFSFFLNLLQRKICWGGKFSSTTGKDFIEKKWSPQNLQGRKGAPQLEGPRGAAKVNIYSLLWCQLTVEHRHVKRA